MLDTRQKESMLKNYGMGMALERIVLWVSFLSLVCLLVTVQTREATSLLKDEERRKRRSAEIISESVVSGLRAAKRLLNTARLNQKRNGFDVYDKLGGNLQALKDFYAVRPKDVKNLPRGAGKAGVIGDRKIQFIRGKKDKTLSLITIRQGERLIPEHIIIYGHKISDKPL